jgi:hypothetical protein
MAAHSRSPGVGLCSQLKHCAWTHVRPGTVLKQCPSSVNLLGWRQAGSKSRGTGVPGTPQHLLTRSRLRRQVCSCRATQKGSAGAPSTTLGTSPQGPGAAVSTAQPSAQPAAVAPPPLQLDASGAPIASSAADFALTAQQLRQLIEANLSSSSSSTTTGVAGEATTQEGHLDVEAIAAGVCSSTATGLSGEPGDVALRRRLYGANALPPAAASSLWQLILEAASDTTLLLLLAAGGVSLGLSAARAAEIADWIDGAAILASVGICVAVTAGTNYNKEAKFRALNALKEDVQVGGWVWWWWGGQGAKGQGQGQRDSRRRQQECAMEQWERVFWMACAPPAAACCVAHCCSCHGGLCLCSTMSQQLPHSCDFSRPTTSTSSCMDATQTTPPSHAVCSPPHTHLPSAPLPNAPPPPHTHTYTGARGAPGCGGLRQLPRPAGGGCGAAGGG